MLNNTPIINCYKDLINLNKSRLSTLSSSKNTFYIDGISYSRNIIKFSNSSMQIDRFLKDYISNPTFVLTGKVDRLRDYDFTRVNYLLYPEVQKDFTRKLREHLNNLALLGETECRVWDFIVGLDESGIVLKGCTKNKIEEVIIPNFITKIDGGAFNSNEISNSKFTKLRTVIFQSGIKLRVLEGITFNCCPIETINLPAGLEEIGDFAFYCCTDLEEINLPDGLKRIGACAFYKCNFISVVIPSSVKVIKERAFEYCSKLRQVTFKNNSRLKVLENNTFDGCIALEKINLPSSLEEIGTSTFSFCRSLEKINIPDSVKILGESAFGWCKSLKEVKIGKGVKDILPYTFRLCNSLVKVTALGNIDTISKDVFDGEAMPVIYIPKESKFNLSSEDAYNVKIIKY